MPFIRTRFVAKNSPCRFDPEASNTDDLTVVALVVAALYAAEQCTFCPVGDEVLTVEHAALHPGCVSVEGEEFRPRRFMQK
jgi:hypothetical protein